MRASPHADRPSRRCYSLRESFVAIRRTSSDRDGGLDPSQRRAGVACERGTLGSLLRLPLPPHLRAPPAGRPIPRRGAGRSATGRSPAGLACPRRAVLVRPPRGSPCRRGLLGRRSRPLRFAARRGAAPARHSDRAAPDPGGLPPDPRRRRYVRRGGVAPQLAGVRGRGCGPERAGRDPARPAPGRPPRHRDESPRSAASEKPVARVVPPRGRGRPLVRDPGRPGGGHGRADPHVHAGRRRPRNPDHPLAGLLGDRARQDAGRGRLRDGPHPRAIGSGSASS